MKKALLISAILILVIGNCNESGHEDDPPSRLEVTMKARIVGIDVDNDTWGKPDVNTTVITETGNVSEIGARVGMVGDTLQVRVLYYDGKFCCLSNHRDDLINLSKQF